ncbi:MAG: hypothetical protein NZ651_07060 [Candidatus Bipolaricaulota bacterium]|nr:hypothetical protein [Candidatus Bipolaricaulota bacterium]MDW8127512.1 hypothetical protein [Candidatus Bipolaricaulota bacterium]
MKAARTIVEYVGNVKPGENVLIYVDTQGDIHAANYLAAAAHAAGAQVSLLLFETRPEVDLEPPAPLAAAMAAADLVIELAERYIIHTRAYLRALQSARVLCLSGLTCEMMKRCVADVDYPKMLEFGDALAGVLQQGNRMEIKTPAGTAIVCELRGRPVEHNAGRICKAGEESFLGGQVSWYPVKETINGTLVFDGSVWPPHDLGRLQEPIELVVERGEIKGVHGGREARRLKSWLESFSDPKMFMIAHFSYGFNPGARLTGRILEDERVFGSIEVGIGAQVSSFEVELASAHTDGVMLSPSVLLDREVIEVEGRFVHPRLCVLAAELLRTKPSGG